MNRSRSILVTGMLVASLTQAGCSTFSGGKSDDDFNVLSDASTRQFDSAQGMPPPQARPGRARMGVAGQRFQRERNSDGLLGWLPKPSEISAGTKDAVGAGPDAQDAEKIYTEADALYHAGKYKEARKLFKKAGSKWPDSSLEEDAIFMAAECEFFLDEYPDASDGYANLLDKYENSRHLDVVVTRQFAIARYWLELQEVDKQYVLEPNLTNETKPWWDVTGNAHAVMQSVWINDPTGPLADDSVFATANDYFVNGRFIEADEYYEQLREDYPKSEHLANAFLLGLQAKLATYQGPDYDPTPLLESEKLIEQALLQFPTQLANERDRIMETRQRIQKLKAERDLFMGEFFAKKKYFQSAAHYHRRVLETAPNTELAAQAQASMEEYRDKPGVPENRFQWFVNLFPGEKERAMNSADNNIQTARSAGATQR